MALARTANPALNETAFRNYRVHAAESMTIGGTVNKTALLVVIALLSAYFTWSRFISTGSLQAIQPFILIGILGGFIIALVTVFKKKFAPVGAPLYAVAEGLALGGISAVFEKSYPGIAVQAIFLTFGILLALLLAYKSRLIRATENFKLGVFAATGGIAIVYLLNFVMGFFGARIPYLFDSSPLGIGISLFIVVIASLNLVLDFDFIEGAASRGAPKYMEWYAAFGLMVTLVWLYLEILRLLSKLREQK
jgi:uncharacterized YccA/Bax inhibitor family protein